MTGTSAIFSKAITFVEFERSGNPQEKYRSGRGVLSKFIREATKTGTYVSYMDQVLDETNSRMRELEKQVDEYYSATFTMSLELRDREAYLRMRALEALEED